MLITYFDEVKIQEKAQPYFWMAALIVSPEQIFRIEEKLNALSQEVFGTSIASKENEFHASAINACKSHFKGWDKERRYKLLNSLLDILCSEKDIGKIVIKINPHYLVYNFDAERIEKYSFQYLVEQVDDYLFSKKMPSLIIGDRDDEISAEKFANYLSTYRKIGTSGPLGKNLKCLIDTAHFTSSHHSRMLQITDFFLWLKQASYRTNNYYLTDILLRNAIDSGVITNIDKFKDWPTQHSDWLRGHVA